MGPTPDGQARTRRAEGALRRDDPCPCGSGNKDKKCCLSKDEAAEHERGAEVLTRNESQAAERRLDIQRLKAEIAARLGTAEDDDVFGDELDVASNAVIDLIKAGKLDEAETVARALQARYPEVHDGWDRLGMVHEARGNAHEAADCYRRVLDFLRDNPDYTDDDGMQKLYTNLVAKLDPPPAAT